MRFCLTGQAEWDYSVDPKLQPSFLSIVISPSLCYPIQPKTEQERESERDVWVGEKSGGGDQRGKTEWGQRGVKTVETTRFSYLIRVPLSLKIVFHINGQ